MGVRVQGGGAGVMLWILTSAGRVVFEVVLQVFKMVVLRWCYEPSGCWR